MSGKPIVGITMGDASGIGPEVIVKCLMDKEVCEVCNPIVIGAAAVVKDAAVRFGESAKVNAIKGVKEAIFRFGTIDVLDLCNLALNEFSSGEASTAAGRASVEFVEKAVQLVLTGRIDAIATAPINKEAINKAGYAYPGHTELLSHLTGCEDYAMMLASGTLRVVHLTTHLSLVEACSRIKRQNVLKTIFIAHRSMQGLGYKSPKIAVAGVNPHAGEGGLFGKEEILEISPAIMEARARGVNVSGPYPPDSVFLRASKGEFDVAIAMYHDQGHIAVKMLGLEEGVNITIGLPVIRTSVDHGTAFDIAGKGLADPQSMKKAIIVAAEMASRRRIP